MIHLNDLRIIHTLRHSYIHKRMQNSPAHSEVVNSFTLEIISQRVRGFPVRIIDVLNVPQRLVQLFQLLGCLIEAD